MVGSSPGSPDGDDDLAGDHHEKKRQPGVKRACNECRQQKVSPNLSLSYSILLARLHKSISASRPTPSSMHPMRSTANATIVPPRYHRVPSVADQWP